MIWRFDVCGIICVCFSYFAVGYADYVVIRWLLIPDFSENLWGVFHVVVFNLIIFLLLIAHTRAMTSDPGVVPLPKTRIDFSDYRSSKDFDKSRTNSKKASRNDQEDGRYINLGKMAKTFSYRTQSDDDDSDVEDPVQKKSSGEDWTVCGRCEAYRPPRAHHCRICKRCIRKMDHHCPWVNNCVGEFNQKYFLQFLLYVGLASIYCLALLLNSWLKPCIECKNDRIKQLKVLHSVCLTVECALFCLFVLAVCCDQFQAILSDETAVEQIQRRRPFRPYKTKYALLKEVFGTNRIICWFLPCEIFTGHGAYVYLPEAQKFDV